MDEVSIETLKRMKKVDFYNGWLVEKVSKHVRGDILEIGCGIGNMTELLVKLGEVTAIDIEKYYIAKTKKRLGKKARVGFGDAETGRFFSGGKKFDTVINFNVLEHIEHDEKAVLNMARRLKRGGKLIILTPAHSLLFGNLDVNLGHYRRYSKNSLSEIFKSSGLVVREAGYVNWFGALGWFVNSRILRRKILPSKQLGMFAALSRPFLFFERFFGPPFGLSVLAIGEKV